MTLLESILDLLLPSNCAECSRPPSVYCRDCLGRHEVRKVERPQQISQIGIALSVLDASVSKAMSAFKEQNQFAIARSMVDALLPTNPFGPIDAVVAAPSAAKSFKKRGFVPAEVIAERIARRWGLARARNALTFERGVADQSSLTVEERQTNLVGSMGASSRLNGRRVLLIDDIVTTGSTLREAYRAVHEAGGEVVGFVVLAETLRRSPPSGHPALSQVEP